MSSDRLFTKEIGDNFTCVGEWWLPSEHDRCNPTLKHSGTLTFSQGEEIRLDIMGQLGRDQQPKDLLLVPPFETIWGRSAEGELITLLNAHNLGMTLGTTGATESYDVRTVFVSENAWVNPGKDITFKSLRLRYTHLAEWVGISGFQVPTPKEFNDFIKRKEAKITYKRPSDPKSIDVRNYAISIAFGNNWPGIRPGIQEATIKQHTSILVKPLNSKEISLSEVPALIRGFQHFLSLLTYDDPIYPLIVEGEMRAENDQGGDEATATLRMLYHRLGTKKPSTELSRHKMLFTFKDTARIWQSALNKLIVVEDDKLEPVYDQFFAEYFSPSAYVEDRFMATIRAIEVFHRRTNTKDYYMKKERYHKTLCKEFFEPVAKAKAAGKIDSSFRDRLQSQLKYGYEFSLRKRLDDLFTTYGEEFLTLFVDKKKNEFIDVVVDTRNWFTHFDEELRHRAVTDGEELASLNLKLQLFMIALLLRHIGIRQEKIEDQFRHYKFNYLRRSQNSNPI